jgi:hypothetical protein
MVRSEYEACVRCPRYDNNQAEWDARFDVDHLAPPNRWERNGFFFTKLGHENSHIVSFSNMCLRRRPRCGGKKRKKYEWEGRGGGFIILSSSIGITRFSQSIIFLDNSNTDDRQQQHPNRDDETSLACPRAIGIYLRSLKACSIAI